MTTIDLAEQALDPAALAQLFTEAHTAGAFADVRVSAEDQDRLLSLTTFPPTAMNIQPLRVLWVESDEARATLGSLAAEGNRDRIVAAPLTAVLAYDVAWHQHLGTLAPFRADAKDSFEQQPQVRQGMAQTNAHLQAGYFMLAARSLGLDVGPMGGFDKDGVDQAFFAENGWRSFMLVNLGYPLGSDEAYRPRQSRLPRDVQSLTV